MEDIFSMDWGWGRRFQDDSITLLLLCILFLLLLHQLPRGWGLLRKSVSPSVSELKAFQAGLVTLSVPVTTILSSSICDTDSL